MRPVTVADCQRVQTDWFRTRAERLGGEVWRDGPLTWTDGPDGQNLMFPTALRPDALKRGTDRARDLGRPIVGAWLALETDASALAAAGFEPGWSPWWMTADLSEVRRLGGEPDPRVEIQDHTSDYSGEHAAYADQLAIARERPSWCWYAAAYSGRSGRFAGRSWSFLDGDLAGVFDMAVWPRFQRRGLGTGLLAAVCAAAEDAGARSVVLNATVDGSMLYRVRGFSPLGQGITWWLPLS